MGQLWIEQVSCYLLLTCLFSYPMCGKCCFALYITRRDFSRQKLLADVATCVGKVVADRWISRNSPWCHIIGLLCDILFADLSKYDLLSLIN